MIKLCLQIQPQINGSTEKYKGVCTVVNVYINAMKTTFDFNFDFYQALKQHGYTLTWKQREAVINSFLCVYLLIINYQFRLVINMNADQMPTAIGSQGQCKYNLMFF